MIKNMEYYRQVIMQLGGREERSKKGRVRGREEEKES